MARRREKREERRENTRNLDKGGPFSLLPSPFSFLSSQVT
jgi:hypothetical protein